MFWPKSEVASKYVYGLQSWQDRDLIARKVGAFNSNSWAQGGVVLHWLVPLRAPIAFGLLVAIGCYVLDPSYSIEFLALAFFAGFGALQLCLDYARQKLDTELDRQRNDVVLGLRLPPAIAQYKAFDHQAWLLVLSLLAGGTLAMGGGILRRAFEASIFHASSATGWSFQLACYTPAPLFWPATHMNWGAVVYGTLLGFVCGLWITWTVSQTDADSASPLTQANKQIERESALIDGFATAFFAAFGVEAALRFNDGLPLGHLDGVPLQWSNMAVPWVVLLSIAGAALTSCGGGLLKALTVDHALLWKPNVLRTVKEWPWKSATRDAAAFGGYGALLYIILTRPAVNATNCLPINSSALLSVTVTCALFGCAMWYVRRKP